MKNNRKAVEDRQRKLFNIVMQQGEISVEEMSDQLGVSSMTIRRDLSTLEKKGLLIRKHGSAASIPYIEKINREDRNIVVFREAISSFAASLLDDGDRIFINGSRTALNMLKYTGDKKIRVMTNNGWALEGNYPENVQIRVTGGYIYEHILVGEYAVESLIGLTSDKLFIGCAAVYADGKFRYDIPSEIGINEMMVSRTKGEIFVLADYSKIHEKEEQAMFYGAFRYPVPVTLVTNEEADPELLEKMHETGIRIMTVSLDGKLTGDTGK